MAKYKRDKPAEDSAAYTENPEIMALRNALESVSDIFIKIDHSWNLQYVSKKTGAAYNIEPEKLECRNIWEAFPWLKGTAIEEKYREAMSGKRSISFEHKDICRERIYNVTVLPDDGGITVSANDITEMKRIEEALRNKERELEKEINYRKRTEKKIKREEELTKKIIDSIPVMITKYNPQENSLFINKEFTRVLGWTQEDAEMNNIMNLCYPDKEHRSNVWAYREKGSTEWREFIVRTKSGEDVLSEWSNIILDDGTQIGIGIDLTEIKKAEMELIESERKYRNLVDNSSVGVYRSTVSGDLLFANRALLEFFEYPTFEEMKKVNTHNLYADQKDRDVFIDTISRIGKHRRYGQKFITKGGTIKYALESVFLEGNVMSGMIVDITDRVFMQKALRKSREKYRELVENANSIILKVDLLGNIVFMNEFGVKFFGYDEDDILGRNVLGTIVPEMESTGKDLKAMVSDILKNPTYHQINVNENIKKNRERVWISWTNRPIYDSKSTLVGILSIGQDITDRKIAEEQIIEQENKFRTLFEASKDAITIVNAKTKEYIDCNRALEELTGYTKQELLTKSLGALTPEEKKEELFRIFELIMSGKETDFEFEMMTKDRGSIPVEVRIKNLMINNIPCAQFIFRDITERKKAERRLLDAYNEQKKVNELKSSILRDVSHELKHPISTIRIATDTLRNEIEKERIDGAKLKRYILMIDRNSEMFDEQLGSVMELSKLETLSSISMQKLCVNDIIHNTITKSRPLAEEKGIVVKADLNEIPRISANREMIASLVRNLLNNAIKYTEKGEIEISSGKHNKGIAITIKDTGIGIGKKDMHNLFKAFYKADLSSDGLGVGLAICRRIAELHNGRITVESEINKGSVFTVFLPLG